MDHHGCGGVGQTTVAGRKVPHTTQQGACCAAHQHQGLEKGKKEEAEHGRKRVRHIRVSSLERRTLSSK